MAAWCGDVLMPANAPDAAPLVVGLDIGGANIKAASSTGIAVLRPFPLWKQPDQLAAAMRDVLAALPPAAALAVTMTGELADGYANKTEGVTRILAAVADAAEAVPVGVWSTGGQFLTPTAAVAEPLQVAAANWHALATLVGRMFPSGRTLLFDVGSTTTDLIPIEDGRVTARGLTDYGRLTAGELLYTGATRTPVCALGPTVTVAGATLPVAAELFATLRDVYLITGDLPEAPTDCDTADGRPATIAQARQRLARMLCCDPEELDSGALTELAAACARRQQMQIVALVERMLDRWTEPVPRVVVSGSGSFLARQVLAQVPRLATATPVLLADVFGADIAAGACAYAVARLLVVNFYTEG